ncbi:hypothetical protein DFH27DRAFT_618408 [Peziza echinospora]|nr:hypothetical protein DFH27DRAFT_618408 [Peziza echinospora]
MPRVSTPRLAPGFTLPTRRTFILPGSEPIADARHLLDQTNEYVVRALNSSYPASIQPTNRTHHLHGYNTRSWFLSTGTWSSQLRRRYRNGGRGWMTRGTETRFGTSYTGKCDTPERKGNGGKSRWTQPGMSCSTWILLTWDESRGTGRSPNVYVSRRSTNSCVENMIYMVILPAV